MLYVYLRKSRIYTLKVHYKEKEGYNSPLVCLKADIVATVLSCRAITPISRVELSTVLLLTPLDMYTFYIAIQ